MCPHVRALFASTWSCFPPLGRTKPVRKSHFRLWKIRRRAPLWHSPVRILFPPLLLSPSCSIQLCGGRDGLRFRQGLPHPARDDERGVGYFSLSESLDGAIHVGTAKYNHNAYLVEFDPRTETQRIVLDTNKTCGLAAIGYAAQPSCTRGTSSGRAGASMSGRSRGTPLKAISRSTPAAM